jgi:DNA polymerase III delta prime subunit
MFTERSIDVDQLDEWTSRAERLVAGGAFLLDAPKGVPAVWGDGEQVAWSKGEPLLLVGPPGVGKTTIAGQLVMARLGLHVDPVLGMPVADGHRLLYLACDRPAQVQRALGRLVDESDRQLLDKRLIVWKGPPPADFARHPDTLITMCGDAGADTVVIDSLKDVALKLSDDETGAALNSALQRAVAEGVEVLALHHQRKNSAGGGKPTRLEDVYGSVWITAGAGSVVLLWGEAGDPVVELSHLKQPAEPIGPFKVLHDHDRGTSSIFEQVDVLQVLLHRPGMTAADLARLLSNGQAPTDSDRERARRKLDRLVRDGHAHCNPGSKGGRGGGTPATYYAATRTESDHGGDHAP